MTASVCHQNFDLPKGHVSALLPALQRAWNEGQREPLTIQPWQNSKGSIYRYVQQWGTLKVQEPQSRRCRRAGRTCAAKLRTQSPRRTWGSLKHCPSKLVNCHMVWRNLDRVAAVGEWLSANSGSQVNPSIKGKSLGHQEVNIIAVDK